MDMIRDDENFFSVNSNDDYKRAVAMVLLFKNVLKVVRRDFKAFQANIAAYTVSLVARTYDDDFDLLKIWDNQGVSQPLSDQIMIWSRAVWEKLDETANGRMVSEWSKKPECWDGLSSFHLEHPKIQIPEILSTNPSR